MKIIKLNRGQTIVDDEDFEYLNQFKWYNHKNYAMRLANHLSISRIVMNAKRGEFVDHINHDTLDNRRKNLRLCSRAENNRNKKYKFNKYGFKGIWAKNSGYQAAISFNYKKIYLGVFKTAREAAIAYNKKAKQLYGVYACLNKV